MVKNSLWEMPEIYEIEKAFKVHMNLFNEMHDAEIYTKSEKTMLCLPFSPFKV